MQMGIDINVYVDGLSEPLAIRRQEDVDAEGTLVANHVQPILDAAMTELGAEAPLDLGDGVIVVKPWRIVAVEYTVFDCSRDDD